MWSGAYAEPNDIVVRSSLNRSFDEIRRMSEARFRCWAVSVREKVARIWDEEGAPPFSRFTTEGIAAQFLALSRGSATVSLVMDELTGRRDCILASNSPGSACRAFFPNIAKVRDADEGCSLWDYFFRANRLEAFIEKLRRQLSRDGFYAFSQAVTADSISLEMIDREPLVEIDLAGKFKLNGYYSHDVLRKTIMLVREPSAESGSDDLRLHTIGLPGEVSSGRECVELFLKWQADGIDKGWDFWLEPNPEDSQVGELTLSKRDLLQLQKTGALPSRYLNEIQFKSEDLNPQPVQLSSFDDAKPTQRFRIRAGYYRDEKIFPKGFRAFSAGLVLGATNFSPIVAKCLYRRFTEDIKDQNEIIIYDSSAGFGGRLLGALAAGTDRQLIYIATDPNPENWLEELAMWRYEALARFYHRNVQQAYQTRCDYGFFGTCSEDMRWNRRFRKYRGKVDIAFTSPPYYRAESYSDDANQSDKKFKTYNEWRDGFLRPTLETTVEWLKPGRPLIWNIADVKIGGSYVPLEADSIAILEALGMKHETTLKLVLAHSPGANRAGPDGRPETKNYCKIKGQYRKYEPIFVYRKPG